MTPRPALRALPFVLPLVLVAGSAFAQDATITAEILTIYRQGQPAPSVAPVVLDRARILCDQPARSVAVLPVPNPTWISWPNPGNRGDECVYTSAAGDVLRMLAADPSVVYELTLRFRTAAGDSDESDRSNLFTRPGDIPARPGRPKVGRAGVQAEGTIRQIFPYLAGADWVRVATVHFDGLGPAFPIQIGAHHFNFTGYSARVGDRVYLSLEPAQ